MKKIKIRFYKYKNHYLIQRKTIFGWKFISYIQNLGYGTIICRYNDVNKESLLNQVLENYYRKDKRFVKIIEYPEIHEY